MISWYDAGSGTGPPSRFFGVVMDLGRDGRLYWDSLVGRKGDVEGRDLWELSGERARGIFGLEMGIDCGGSMLYVGKLLRTGYGKYVS